MQQNRQVNTTGKANNTPLISIIVPVYKTPVEFLSKCIQSITNQTYSSFEVLLVDDGSPAPYQNDYKKIAQSDNRISFIRRQNGSGDWCLFIDADDWIEHTLCCDALTAAGDFYSQNGFQADLIFFPYQKEYGKRNENVSYFQNDFVAVTDQACNKLHKQVLYLESTLGSVWAKMYRTDFIKNSGVLFDTALSFGEDIEFNFRLFKYLKSAVYIHKFNYHYRYDGITVSNAFNPQFADKAERFAQKLYADAVASTPSEQAVLVALTNARIIHSILGIALRYCFHRDNPRSAKEKLNDFKKIRQRTIFARAIEQARYCDFSHARKIALFCLKHKFDRCIRFIAYMRRIQYAVKS